MVVKAENIVFAGDKFKYNFRSVRSISVLSYVSGTL